MSKYKPVPEHLKTHTLENGTKVTKAKYDAVQKWAAKQEGNKNERTTTKYD